MKKLIYLTFICFSIVTFGNLNICPLGSQSAVHAKEVPPYAKWGNIAVQKTKEKYPDAQVVDYLHIGREDKGSTSVEKFKLWVKGNDREFGVLVNIEFSKATEKTVKISYQEVAS